MSSLCILGFGVLQCIIAKEVFHLDDLDTHDVCGALQVCAVCECGYVTAVHAVYQLLHYLGLQLVLLLNVSINKLLYIRNLLQPLDYVLPTNILFV